MVTSLNIIENILTHFKINGNYIEGKPFGSGHINDTFLVTFHQDGSLHKYILRKINSYVFKNPQLIIENTINVTNHIRKKLLTENEKGINRRVLTLVEATNNQYHYFDDNGEYWCLFLFIEDAYSVDSVDNPDQAFEAAKAYGAFQKYLLDFNIDKCHVTIPDFHNLDNRIKLFNESKILDPKKRIESIPEVVNLADKYEHLIQKYLDLQHKNIPLRITHNDTKINNIMLDKKTNKGLCVVDLDTVMPGIILNDFGDMVRTFTSPAMEDEKDFSKVIMRLPIFDALVEGYLSELNAYLTQDEIDNLVVGSRIIVYEQAIRFLKDFIDGDFYYRTGYELHNLKRAQNQFALLASIEEQSYEMEAIVKKYSNDR